jgi:hypothetical protein
MADMDVLARGAHLLASDVSIKNDFLSKILREAQPQARRSMISMPN